MPRATTADTARSQRAAPTRASELASRGGDRWSVEDSRLLWWYRHRQTDGGPLGYKDIGSIFGRTDLACRGAIFKLINTYIDNGRDYEKTFGQQRPANLAEPPKQKRELEEASKEPSLSVETKGPLAREDTVPAATGVQFEEAPTPQVAARVVAAAANSDVVGTSNRRIFADAATQIRVDYYRRKMQRYRDDVPLNDAAQRLLNAVR